MGIPRQYDAAKQAKVKATEAELDIPFTPLAPDSCVYKLHYGGKYLIIKGENLPGSIFFFKKGYAYHVGYNQQEGDARSNKLYIAFYRHIQRHPGLQFSVEVITTGTPYQLLKAEQLTLDAALKDSRCLNSNLEAYMPQYRPKNKKYGGWISKGDYLNFRKWIKARNS
jgi:hypothetical protein